MIKLRPLLLSLLLASSAAHSEVLFSTIPSTGPVIYDFESGWSVGERFSGVDFKTYFLFSPTSSGFATSATAVVTNYAYPFGQSALLFEIRADDGGQPGAVLGNSVAPGSTRSGPMSVQFDQGVELTQGQQYWFGLSAVDRGTHALWIETPLNMAGSIAVTGAYGFGPPDAWYFESGTMGAFTISAVPEPATWVMMGLGLAGLGALAQRRKAEASAA